MRKLGLSWRSSGSVYFAGFRDQRTILSKLSRWMRRSGLICLARSSRTGLDMSHILFMVEILLLDRKSGSAGMPRPISYAVFCLKKKKYVAEAQTVVAKSPEVVFTPTSFDPKH